MKKLLFSLALTAAALGATATDLFFYSPENGDGGLRFALRNSDGSYSAIGNGRDYLRSDFGPWGSGKKMWSPQLFPTSSGWACLFRADPKGEVIALAESPDLIHWKPQQYMNPADTAHLPFRGHASVLPEVADINGVKVSGYVMKADDSVVESLMRHALRQDSLAALYSERCADDPRRFADLGNISATLTATGGAKEISPLLTGIFFEDINYAADGGLYAELIQNRDFEYSPSERERDGWGPKYAWSATGDNIEFEIATDSPVHPNNPHFARLNVKGGITNLVNSLSDSFGNEGFDGIPLKKGEPYRFRVKARADKKMPVEIYLVSGHGRKLASGKITVKKSTTWQDYELVMTPDEHTSDASLRIVPKMGGTLDLDMVSLFPVNTFNGRENGLRADLAKALADLHPRFVRFPGGCVAHGNGLDNVYDWKGSIGQLEARKPLYNLWGYHQTRGLGYHEYFQFCEDIGAEPLPVVAAGVPCQNSGIPSRFSHDPISTFGQQGGLPLDSLDSYIQDIIDLVEYANGDPSTTWGAKRAQAGHPAPFNLKYIGIGNEDMITPVFEERFSRINAAVKKAHPEITVIGTVGPFYEGSDYDEGWRFAKAQNVDMVDEHYYVDPAWLIYNQHYYDSYDREGPKVYLGEWAAHLPGRPSNMETALAEALYLTALERNGDIVAMSSYAPLLAKKGHTQWKPDLIYFDNTDVMPTTDWHAMKIFGENAGTKYMQETLDVATGDDKARNRIGASIVADDATGDVIVKMVNLLPVATDMTVDLSKIFPNGEGLAAVRTVMSGQPADKKASVKTDRVALDSPLFVIPLPEYSLTVVRIKNKRL